MTRTEHLLTILAEECSEVAQRVSKALRFGLTEVQPGQSLTNAERVRDEMVDLLGVYAMLEIVKSLPPLGIAQIEWEMCEQVFSKQRKVEKFLAFSAGRGLVDGIPADPATVHPEAK